MSRFKASILVFLSLFQFAFANFIIAISPGVGGLVGMNLMGTLNQNRIIVLYTFSFLFVIYSIIQLIVNFGKKD